MLFRKLLRITVPLDQNYNMSIDIERVHDMAEDNEHFDDNVKESIEFLSEAIIDYSNADITSLEDYSTSMIATVGKKDFTGKELYSFTNRSSFDI